MFLIIVHHAKLEIGGLFLRLKNIMVSELHLQWDLVFLEQYVTESMVPRSLRWDIHPQQGDGDFESWFKYFNDAGIDFLSFLITRKRDRLSVLDREIRELKDGLLTYKNSVEYNSLSSNLQVHLIKEDKDQRTKKHKKYLRNVGDYKSGRVFSWQKPSTPSTPDPSMEINTPILGAVVPPTDHPVHPKPSMIRSQPQKEGSQHQRGRHQSTHTPRYTKGERTQL